jgi:hypothetical protein
VEVEQNYGKLREAEDRAARELINVQERLRRMVANTTELEGGLVNCDGELLTKLVMEDDAPWRDLPVPAFEIPGMVTPEEKQYYHFITGFFSGFGEVVELGPWLGCSTACIVEGLMRNPRFGPRQLYVFDDFIWRSSWMDAHYGEADRPDNHQSFREIFDRYTFPWREHLSVAERRFSVYDGNDAVAPLEWHWVKIEMCFIDCGRTMEVNDAWYSMLSSFFIPGRTLLVLQDWQTHKEIPQQWYNQMKMFTDSKGDELELVHELSQGGIATFLYKGQRVS